MVDLKNMSGSIGHVFKIVDLHLSYSKIALYLFIIRQHVSI